MTDAPTFVSMVLALSLRGMRPKMIARRLDVPVSRVYSARTYLRAQGHDFRGFLGGEADIPSGAVNVSGSALTALIVPAAQRGISPEDLAARIIDVVCADNLVEIVLDDGVSDD